MAKLPPTSEKDDDLNFMDMAAYKQRAATLSFADYQQFAKQTDISPAGETKLYYLGLGLAGEAGEVANKVKKIIRDKALDSEAIASELGDVLWYLAVLARELDIPLEYIARANLDKLAERRVNGTLHGNGDER